mgnify:CR=1 FL=1
MMERFARFTLRHNRLIISTIILLDLIALYFVFTRFAISGDILSFFRTGFKESEEFKTISEKYKGLNVILIGMKKADITSR